MENSKIACSSRRLRIVEPNHFGGLDSSSNVPVNIEDLNISVVLTTFKKGRTILTANNEPGKKNTIDTQGTVSINFIDGSNINGKQVLTSNYTDLTTIFDDNTTSNAGEGLGITSIDIDFNSQQAPMITINFIDVRGSAIFQNEENIKAGKNKYSTFFQLPYPLFKLTIKGYYGLPVEYCLHMYKFNSKFNSQTGNFEITANFIGFTYAMMSDMLIGYLKAIPYTDIGEKKYEEINTIRKQNGLDDIMNLNDLMIAIAKINESIKQLSADDVNSIELGNIENKFTALSRIKDILVNFCSKMDIRKTTAEPYAIVCKPNTYDEVNVDKILTEYKEDMDKALAAFNENSNIQLDATKFDMSFNKNGNGLSNYNAKNFRNDINKNSTNIKSIELVNTELDTLEANFIKDDAICSFWVNTLTNRLIKEADSQLEEARNVAKENLGKTIKSVIKEKLFLDPTIRNIIEIFTTAVEVFMESIYTVSSAAEANPNALRNDQLKTKFLDSGNVDIKNIKPSDTSILAWPGYREKKNVEGRETFTERYLGAKNVLEIPTNVNEIAFIEDLLKAFIEAAAKTDLAVSITNQTESSWFPINPVDTRLFGITTSPYDRIGQNGLTSHKQVANLMLIRGMTFLGYNNQYLTTAEIEYMAEIETMTMIKTVKDTKAKLGLSNLTLEEFIGLKGIINGTERNIIQILNTDEYTYTYFPTNNDTKNPLKIIPINQGFDETWEINNGIWEFSGPDESIFLTNYNYNTNENKTIDGGTYIRIFGSQEFSETINLDTSVKPEKLDINDNTILLEKIKNEITDANSAKDAGFRAFGGEKGIQEFVKVKWDGDNSDLDNLTLNYIFYKNNSEYGLAIREDKDSKTPYDLGTFNYKDTGITSYFDDSLLASSWSGKDEKNLLPTKFNNLGENLNVMVNFDPSKTSYPFVEAKYIRSSVGTKYYYSLFGSRFYYGQSLGKYPLYSKALLFLSTLPWNGMPFEKTEILQLFNIRAGFIHVPRLWAAYVGGLLWRQSKSNPVTDPSNSSIIIGGGSGNSDPIIFKKGSEVLHACNINYDDWIVPTRTQNLNNIYSVGAYSEELPEILKYLPNQVKSEFKKIFFNFVDIDSVSLGINEYTYDFKTLNNLVQLVSDGKIETFDEKLNAVYKNIKKQTSLGTHFSMPTIDITKNLDNLDKYQQVVPLTDDNSFKRQINLMFKGTASDNESPVGIIVNMINEEVVIANSGYKIWKTPNIVATSGNTYHPIFTKKDNFETYFNKVITIMKDKISSSAIAKEIDEKEQQIFGTSDSDAIKFQLYKTCKNINDKWLGGVTDINNIIFQCGGSRNKVDEGLKEKYRKGDTKTRLIDSFRFVDRAFLDIGDLFYMNPVPVNDYLMNSPNTSIFDAVSQLLASNNFTFVPLPTFINYNDEDTLKSMFNTYPNYDDAIKDGICGPSFVAVYAGDSSKHLDFADSEYPNDGIDFQCGGPTKGDVINVPSDFVGTSNDYENDVAVFSVNYGQQNQNIFKDITLDQSEFSETDESLKISDDIAHKGVENNVSIGGQNIYNVYSVRSYKAEVEMLGNAMIQPMMHFQLNNIPMFHGAYLITRVKHSIKPNYMSTVFSGSRVRYPKTELLSGVDFYMGLLNSLNLSNAGSSTTGTVGRGGSVPPIIATIIENGGIPSDIEKGNITMTAIPPIPGIRSQIASDEDKGKNRLISEAIEPLKEMMKDWIAWMIKEGFTGFKYPNDNNIYYAQITSAFRSPEDQSKAGVNKAPGISYHQYGIAIDFKLADKKGNLIKTEQNLKWFKISNNPALEWLLGNSWKYGFASPYGIRDGKGKYNEYWHYEYHGTAAKCIMETNPLTVGGYKTIISKGDTQKTNIVKNPKGKDGKPAIYNDCRYVFIKNDQGTVDDGEQIETKLIYEELKKQLGYSDEAIAGVMGNLYTESRFIPDALNKSADPGAYGLAQWKSSRKTDLKNYIANNNVSPVKYKQQIQFLKHEILTKYKYTDAAMKKETDVTMAARIWYVTYELTSLGNTGWSEESFKRYEATDKSGPQRINYAKQFSQMIKSKKFSFPR